MSEAPITRRAMFATILGAAIALGTASSADAGAWSRQLARNRHARRMEELREEEMRRWRRELHCIRTLGPDRTRDQMMRCLYGDR